MIVHSTYYHYIIADKLICGRRICRTILGWGQARRGPGLNCWMQTRSSSSTCCPYVWRRGVQCLRYPPVFIGQTGQVCRLAHLRESNCGPAIKCRERLPLVKGPRPQGPKPVWRGPVMGHLRRRGTTLNHYGPVALCHESKRSPLAPAGANPRKPETGKLATAPAAPLARLLLPSLRRSDFVICRPRVVPRKGISRSGFPVSGFRGIFAYKGVYRPPPGPLSGARILSGATHKLVRRGENRIWATPGPSFRVQKVDRAGPQGRGEGQGLLVAHETRSILVAPPPARPRMLCRGRTKRHAAHGQRAKDR